MTMQVLFASVPVTELAEARPWYEQLFGRAADVVPNDTECMWKVSGDGWLYVIEDPGRAGATVVTVAVDDLDRFVADLGARGIRSGPIEAVGEAGRKATVVDVDGNAISWIEVFAESR